MSQHSGSEPAEIDRSGPKTERGRRTLRRLLDAAGEEFGARGYHETAISNITQRAGVGLGTFYVYFKSKEDILFVWQHEGWSAVWEDLRTVSPDENPLDAVRAVFLRHLARHANDEMRAIDRLLRASETLRARKQAAYEEHERALFATLCEVWRQPQRRPALRILAMACIGVVRLSLETWNQQEATGRAIADVLQEGFAQLKAGFQ